MKIYQKKNASFEDETVLVQLERRHTLKEVSNEGDSEAIRKTTRANSLDMFEEGHSSTDIEAVATEKKSGFTRKPTIITESELSSSRLYKDRKAKINSDDESVEDPRSTLPTENHGDLEPSALHDPTLMPVPVSSQRPRKMSSCCWYFAIILVICIACLAVMAGVGGIVYMEIFATYKKLDNTDTDTLVKNAKNPSNSKEILQYPPHKQDNLHLNEPKIPEHILKDVIKNSEMHAADTDAPRKVSVIISPSKGDIFRNKDLPDSNNGKKEVLNVVKSSFISKNQDKAMTEYSKTTELSDIFPNTRDSINRFNVPVSDKSGEIKRSTNDQNSLDFKLNYKSVDDIMNKMSNGYTDDDNEQMTENETIIDENSTSETEIPDSSEGSLASGRNFKFGEMTTLQGLELIVEQVNEHVPFQNLSKESRIEHAIHLEPNNNLPDHMKNSIDVKPEDNFFDHRKHSIPHDPKDNSLDPVKHSITKDPKDNSLDHANRPIEHSLEVNSLDNTKDFKHHNNKSLNDHNEDSIDFDSHGSSPTENSLADDHNQNSDDSDQLVFIRPVVESKAVPVPLAFLRRIGFDIKNPNSHQPMTAKDMDIKFSLAEALKYLRSLDTDNKLLASREKNVTQERSKQEESTKTKLPVKSERKEYLNVLRKKMFDHSL